MERIRDGLVVEWAKLQLDSDMEVRYRSSDIDLRDDLWRERWTRKKKSWKKIMAWRFCNNWIKGWDIKMNYQDTKNSNIQRKDLKTTVNKAGPAVAYNCNVPPSTEEWIKWDTSTVEYYACIKKSETMSLQQDGWT